MQFSWPVSSEAPTSQAAVVFAISDNETTYGLDWVNLWSHGGMSVNWAGEFMVPWYGLRIGRYAYILLVNCWLLGACLRDGRANL
jgi:hypothetical protein